MARIRYPGKFDELISLFSLIKKKHDEDGSDSVLIQFLTEQEISLDGDQETVDAADELNKIFAQAQKDSEKLRVDRDNLFLPVFKDHKSCVQFLKNYYVSNNKKLGDWTINVNGKGRVVYAKGFAGRQKNILDFINYYQENIPGSPLTSFLTENLIDLNQNKTKTEDSFTKNTVFDKKIKEKEKKRVDRDNKIMIIKTHIRFIGGFLMNFYTKNPHILGDYGFIIIENAVKTKEREGKVSEKTEKMVQQLKVNSIFKNTGTVSLEIYKGKIKKGKEIILNPGEEMTIVRGLGSITIINNDAFTEGRYKGIYNA